MNMYLAKWPDGSASLVEAVSEIDLYLELDKEGDPSCAIIKKITGDGPIHLTFNIVNQNKEQFIDADIAPEAFGIDLRKFSFKKDIFYKYIAAITGDSLKQVKNLPESRIKQIKDHLGLQ